MRNLIWQLVNLELNFPLKAGLFFILESIFFTHIPLLRKAHLTSVFFWIIFVKYVSVAHVSFLLLELWVSPLNRLWNSSIDDSISNFNLIGVFILSKLTSENSLVKKKAWVLTLRNTFETNTSKNKNLIIKPS